MLNMAFNTINAKDHKKLPLLKKMVFLSLKQTETKYLTV